MFAPVLLNTDDNAETNILTFVTFRMTLKSMLRNKYESVFHEKPDKSMTTKKLMRSLQKHVSFSGESLKTAERHMNAVSCGTYMAEVTYSIYTMLAALNYEFNVSSELRKIYGIINDSPRTGDAMKKIIFALDMFDELASCHECFEVLDIPTCIDTIDCFLEKTTALVLNV
ncbi:hypothetical protein PBCVCan184_018L [Paramecium bursaria Chlorella virus Can18-4]|nr:hypothetical protein PBCVCan184_018L [Paramecium bursaria Chlorella virus Can18-4]